MVLTFFLILLLKGLLHRPEEAFLLIPHFLFYVFKLTSASYLVSQSTVSFTD